MGLMLKNVHKTEVAETQTYTKQEKTKNHSLPMGKTALNNKTKKSKFFSAKTGLIKKAKLETLMPPSLLV